MAAESENPSLVPPHRFSTSANHFTGLNTSELLPPSCYEGTAAPDGPWSSLAQATSELLDLKARNEALKHEMTKVQERVERCEAEIVEKDKSIETISQKMAKKAKENGEIVARLRELASEKDKEISEVIEAEERERRRIAGAFQNELDTVREELANERRISTQDEKHWEKRSRRDEANSESLSLLPFASIKVNAADLQSANDLLTMQLSAATEILNVQQAVLDKSLAMDSDGKMQRLLSCWRDRVFSLLVQLKCLELKHGREFQGFKAEKAELLKRSSKWHAESEELRQVLNGKSHLIEHQSQSHKMLERESRELSDTVDRLSKEKSFILNAVSSKCQRLSEQCLSRQSGFNRFSDKLIIFEQRLALAMSRIALIKGKVRSDSDEMSSLKEELCNVTKERDALLISKQDDQDSFQAAKEEIQSTLAEQLRQKTNSLASLERALGEERQRNGVLESNLASAQASVGELTQEVESLQAELACSRECEERHRSLAENKAELEARLDESEKKFSQVFSELAQIKSRAERDRALLEKQHALEIEAVQQELTACREQLKVTEREKNILMITLRQEGLIKRQRQQPRRGRREDDVERPAAGQDVPAILQDLRDLSQALQSLDQT